MNYHEKVQKSKALKTLEYAEEGAKGVQQLLDVLVPQVYGKRSPINCIIQSFQTVDNARIGNSVLRTHLKWLKDFIKNIFDPRPEMFNILSRSAEMLFNEVHGCLAERIGRLTEREQEILKERFERILRSTLGNRIDELKRQIDGICPCCGGMGRVPYGSGIPDYEEYDLCPVCHWEKIADVLKGKTRRVDESA